MKRLKNGIFVKSNTERFTEFTNCNLSQRLVETYLTVFSMMLKSMSFPLTVPNRLYLKLEERLFLQTPEFYQLHTV